MVNEIQTRIRMFVSSYSLKIAAFVLIAMLVFIVTACASNNQSPETVTLWHVYGGQTESPLNSLIDQFNATVGKDKNICVQVTSITNTNTIHENVLSSAYCDPGAGKLPDMFVSYPKTVLALPDDSILLDYREHFEDEELAEFVPAFLEEGFVHDRLTILPIAKSTEIMFVNQTAFERFSAETGIQISDLATWEGLFKAAERYSKWTDAKTEYVDDDGKPFFVHDYHFDYFQVGVESLGEKFFRDENLAFGPEFNRVWEPYARAALVGGIWLQSGYATEPLRTEDAIVSVASSASILYYSGKVTHEDNTSEEIELRAYPCPVMEDGKKLVMQRGAGICTVKSTPSKENACITFLKWLTDAERNVEFVTQAGYMPVKQESFKRYLRPAIENLTNPSYRSLYEAFLATQEDYEFYVAPKLDTYLDLEMRFEKIIRQNLTTNRNDWLKKQGDLEDLGWQSLTDFKLSYMQ